MDCYTASHMANVSEIKVLESDEKPAEGNDGMHTSWQKNLSYRTAHVSLQSVDDVRKTIEIVRPDTIAVELCPPRHEALTDKERWKKMDIFKVIRSGKAVFLLAQLIIASFTKRSAIS